ncbi:MAG TPA: AAA family ATPase, partial [Paludibacter sp.]|nr:AAA family ATPase [Paludibacter sp.]
FKDIIPFFKTSYLKDIHDLNRDGIMEFELSYSNSLTKRIFTYHLILEWKTKFFKGGFKIKTEELDVKESNKPGPSTSIFKRNYGPVKYGTEVPKMTGFDVAPDYLSVIRILKMVVDLRDDYKDAIDSLNEILKTPIFYFSNIELLKTDKERLNSFNGRVVSFELSDEIIALEEGDKWNIFKDVIKNILGIEDVSVGRYGGDTKIDKIPLTKYLNFVHNGIFKTINQFSDGTILIIALITKILSTKNHLFLIEEPENSTHPKALIDLISFLKSFSENTQFIITSHSIAILNKTKIEDIIVSSINENGQSEFYNISDRKDLKNKLKKSSVNFSDELFFNIDDKNEFE